MRLFILNICYLFVAGSLITCRQSDPEPDRLLDGTPRLKSISFSGIPQENISIDQKTKVIAVTMPSIILDKIAVVLELTDNAEWIEKNAYYVAPNSFGCESCFEIVLKDKKDTSGSLDKTVYTVKTIPAAPLKVALLSQPIPYSIRDESNLNPFGIDIPMVNLYGNKLPKEAQLTHDITGEELVVKRVPFYSESGVYYSRNANKLGIYLYDAKLLPGTYHINLLLDDGTILKVSQPLLITKGTPIFDYEPQTYFGYRAAVGTSFTTNGYNLFEGDISFDLVDRQGKIHSVSGLIFERYGQQIQIPVPASLTPGQYVLRVYIKGVEQPYCLRVNILKDNKEHPILGTLVTKEPSDASPCSLLNPVIAQRGVALFLTSNQEKSILDKFAQHLTLKLVSFTNGSTYYGSVVPYDYANSAFPGSFTVPSTVPPGLYTAILQVVDIQNNVIDESEAYGRVLDVR